MRLPRPTKGNQFVLRSAVVALLTANAFAMAFLAGDDDVVDPLQPPAAGAPGAEAPRSLTLITTADGRRILADPSTPEGRKAIADAERDGSTIREVTIPSTTSTTEDTDSSDDTVAGRTGPSSGLDLSDLLGRIAGDGTVEIPRDAPQDLLGGTIGTVTSIAGGAVTTVSSLVGGGGTTVSSTVSSLAGGTVSTVSSLLAPVQSTVTSVVNQVTTPTTAPSLLGGVVTTVSSIVQLAVPTTTAPATTTPTTSVVCGLLVHC